MTYTYYAVFKKSEDGGYDVVFPDIIAGVTCGDSFEDALFMAKDLLKLMINDVPNQCYKPSSKEEIEKEYPNDLVIEVSVEGERK